MATSSPNVEKRNIFDEDDGGTSEQQKKEKRDKLLHDKKMAAINYSKKSPEQLFAQFDSDQSGSINFEEFKEMLPQLGIVISAPKQLKYFQLCDVDSSGTIDFNEFKIALFVCDPNSGNTAGFCPNQLLTPMDAFEMMDDNKTGFIDEDEFFFACEYLGLGLSEQQLESLFQTSDKDKSGKLDYNEFKHIWVSCCDIRKELVDRGIEVPSYTRKSTLVKQLIRVLEEEEKKEITAMEEAERWRKWQIILKKKNNMIQRAAWRGDIELRKALDTCGQVYVFGHGSQMQFAETSNSLSASSSPEAARVKGLWSRRVKPMEFIVQWERDHGLSVAHRSLALSQIDSHQSNAEATGSSKFQRLEYVSAASVDAASDSKFRMLVDPYQESLMNKMRDVVISASTAAIWGKRIVKIAASDSVMFGLSELGEVYSWGGADNWWHEMQAESRYSTEWRGDTTYRSQLLLQTRGISTVDLSSVGESDGNDSSVGTSSEEKLKLVAKYFGVWKPPPSSISLLVYLQDELMPLVKFDDMKYALECRGIQLKPMTKLELVGIFCEAILMERRLLGEKSHRALRDLEQRSKHLRKQHKFENAQEIEKQIVNVWYPLKEIQAEAQAESSERILKASAEKFAHQEEKYIEWREDIVKSRETLEPAYTPRGNSLRIEVSGITPRGNGLHVPQSYQFAVGMSAGSSHACLLHLSGQLYSWGMGASGRLGLDAANGGDPQSDAQHPTFVQSLRGVPMVGVSCGFNHTVAVAAGGSVYVWGSCSSGKLGLGNASQGEECYCSVPTMLPFPNRKLISQVACGFSHSAAVTDDGSVFVWGCGDGGRLGLGRSAMITHYSPTIVPNVSNIVSVSCGGFHTLALTRITTSIKDDIGKAKKRVGGKLYAAGSGNILGIACQTFTLLDFISEPVSQISCGYRHSAFVTDGGELYSWGHDINGSCGHGSVDAFIERPKRVNCMHEMAQNVALGKPCRQSSTFSGQEADLAVNGDFDASNRKNCSCTHQDPQAWWEVDLGEYAYIERVVIWNRADSPSDPSLPKDYYSTRLFPNWVLICQAELPDTTGGDSLKFALEASVARMRFTEDRGCSVWKVPLNTMGRYVRVQVEGLNFLHMCQVEVFATFGVDRGISQVSHVQCGRDITVATINARKDPLDVESSYVRAVYADAANADVLRGYESFMLFYDKFGRGDVLDRAYHQACQSVTNSISDTSEIMAPKEQLRCLICRKDVKCEICELLEDYADELLAMPRGIGGRRPTLAEIGVYLQTSGAPDILKRIRPLKPLIDWKEKLSNLIQAFKLRRGTRKIVPDRK